MTGLVRAYDRLTAALAGVAAAALGMLFAVIVYDVAMRELGLRPPVWTTAFSEFALLYATALAAPWLLRQGGHVTIGAFVAALSPIWYRRTQRLAYAIGLATCLIVALYAARVTLTVQGLEIRGFELPRWLAFLPLPVGFALLSVEFARLLLRPPPPDGDAPTEGL